VLQGTLDSVLKHYIQGRDVPVPEATVVRLGTRALADDLTEAERLELFVFARCLTFAALAGRRFFAGLPGTYTNTDSCAFYIQQFSDPNAGFTVVARRLDGAMTIYSPNDVYAVHHPYHVVPGEPLLDVTLLEALLRLAGTLDWPTFDNALFSFNSGNTDSPDVPEQARLVHVVGAFEQALGCRSGSENALADAFTAAWRPSRTLPLLPATRNLGPRAVRADGPPRTLPEVWIRDLFTYRGNLAHGRQETGHSAIWSLREHQLLGAYVFPRLLKLLLAGRGLYTLSDRDQDEIDALEQLARIPDLFAAPSDQQNSLDSSWVRVYGNCMSRRTMERILERHPDIAADHDTAAAATQDAFDRLADESEEE